MTFLEARKKVVHALDGAANVLNDPHFGVVLRDASVDVQFSELELDSLAAIECCLALEDDIGIELDPAHLAIYSSVNALADYIANAV